MRTVFVTALWFFLCGMSACGGGQNCAGGCPATRDTADVLVSTGTAMAVNGVQATLTGPVTGAMSCQPDGTFTLCEWPAAVAATAGIYTLQVSAPGYQPITTLVAVVISPVTCGCTMANVEPATLALSPSDGGLD
jgi:hypothetical protein